MDCMTIWNHSWPPLGGLKSALACSLGLGALQHGVWEQTLMPLELSQLLSYGCEKR